MRNCSSQVVNQIFFRRAVTGLKISTFAGFVVLLFMYIYNFFQSFLIPNILKKRRIIKYFWKSYLVVDCICIFLAHLIRRFKWGFIFLITGCRPSVWLHFFLLLFRTTNFNSYKLGTKHTYRRGILNYWNSDRNLFQRGDNHKTVKIGCFVKHLPL